MALSACKIVVGIPVTPTELREAMVDPRGRDLVTGGAISMSQYTREIIQPFATLIPVWRALGARVHTGVTAQTLAREIAQGPTALLVLLSHWVDEPEPAIELFDGMRPVAEVAALLPADFDGAVDLCICQSLALSKQVHARCPKAIVKWLNVPATPVVWFHILTLTLRIMHDEAQTYLYAVDKALRSYRDVIRPAS